MNKRIWFSVFLMLFSISGIMICQATGIGHSNDMGKYHADTLQAGKSIPSFELITPSGELFNNHKLNGKIVVLDFWATWCAPCRKLSAQLDSLLGAQQKNNRLVMLGVNYREYQKEAALKYWREHDYSFPMVSDKDALGNLISAGNPTILVIDGTGTVRGRWDAYSAGTSLAVKQLVVSLLK